MRAHESTYTLKINAADGAEFKAQRIRTYQVVYTVMLNKASTLEIIRQVPTNRNIATAFIQIEAPVIYLLQYLAGQLRQETPRTLHAELNSPAAVVITDHVVTTVVLDDSPRVDTKVVNAAKI